MDTVVVAVRVTAEVAEATVTASALGVDVVAVAATSAGLTV